MGSSMQGKAHIADLTADSDGKPLIGMPLGRKQFVLEGVIVREVFKVGRLIGWHDFEKTQPILQYPDGLREVLFSMTETNWGRGETFFWQPPLRRSI